MHTGTSHACPKGGGIAVRPEPTGASQWHQYRGMILLQLVGDLWAALHSPQLGEKLVHKRGCNRGMWCGKAQCPPRSHSYYGTPTIHQEILCFCLHGLCLKTKPSKEQKHTTAWRSSVQSYVYNAKVREAGNSIIWQATRMREKRRKDNNEPCQTGRTECIAGKR